MLNDLSRQTRLMIFVQTLGFGLMLGCLLAVSQEALTLAVVLLAVGLVVEVSWVVFVRVWLRRADREVLAELGRGSLALVTGAVAGVEAPGRVLRLRAARRDPGFVRSSPVAAAAPSYVVVLTVLAETGARRVAALVPADVAPQRAGTPVVVLLHPDLDEVAVLDVRPDPAVLAAGDVDPRWTSDRLPSDRRVVGGYLALVAAAAVGLLVGLAFDGALVAAVG